MAKELKNAQKRRRRLKARARQLSNDDLLAVLLMRKDDMADVAATAAPNGATPAGVEPVATTAVLNTAVPMAVPTAPDDAAAPSEAAADSD